VKTKSTLTIDRTAARLVGLKSDLQLSDAWIINMAALVLFATSFGFAPLAQANHANLGRLFFTPAERTQLEQHHKQQAYKAQMSASGDEEQASITVNGLIKRSDGSRIVWVNGRAQKLSAGGDPNKVPVTVPGQSKPVQVKVGQRVLIDAPAPAKTTPSKQTEDDD